MIRITELNETIEDILNSVAEDDFEGWETYWADMRQFRDKTVSSFLEWMDTCKQKARLERETMGKIDWDKIDKMPEYACKNCGHKGDVFLREVVSGQPFCSCCGSLDTEEIVLSKALQSRTDVSL